MYGLLFQRLPKSLGFVTLKFSLLPIGTPLQGEKEMLPAAEGRKQDFLLWAPGWHDSLSQPGLSQLGLLNGLASYLICNCVARTCNFQCCLLLVHTGTYK